VAHLQDRLSRELPRLASPSDGQPASVHTELFSRRDQRVVSNGRWVGEPAGKRQLLLADAAALDTADGRQFVLPANSVQSNATLVEFHFEPDIAAGDPTRAVNGLQLAPVAAKPTLRAWMPLASRPDDCKGWRQLNGDMLTASADTASGKLTIRVGGQPLEPDYIYRADFDVSIRGHTVAQSRDWVKGWTVKGDGRDEYDEFKAAHREVVGVANLDTMIEILSKAEHQSGLDLPSQRVTFVFRVGSGT
jgi:hypothetical protein